MRRARIARVLAALQHPGEPVERGVGIGAAHRLVQRRDQVVVAVAATCRRARARRVRRSASARGVERRAGSAAICSTRLSSARPSPSAMRDQRVRAPRASAAAGGRASASARASEAAPARPRRAGAASSTRARESSAALSSKDGFSVVAPTRTMVPSSISGRKASCWALLKRWISSTKSSVPRPFCAAQAGGLEDLPQVGDAGEDRADLHEGEVGGVGEQPGDGGLADAGRAPEDDRAEARPRRASGRAGRRGRAGGPGRRPRRAAAAAAGRPAAAAPRRSAGGILGAAIEEVGHGHFYSPAGCRRVRPAQPLQASPAPGKPEDIQGFKYKEDAFQAP